MSESKGKITKRELHSSLIELIEQSRTKLVNKKSTSTILSPTNQVEIGINEYDKETDIIMVYKDSVYLEEELDYTVSEDSRYIINSNGNWDIKNDRSIFNFIIIKNIPEATEFDGSIIKDGTIGVSELSEEVLSMIQNGCIGGTSNIVHEINISSDEWQYSEETMLYYKNVNHNLNTNHLAITAKTTDTKENVEIGTKQLNMNNVRIYNESDIDITLTFISTTGISSFVLNQINDMTIDGNKTWSGHKINKELDKIKYYVNNTSSVVHEMNINHNEWGYSDDNGLYYKDLTHNLNSEHLLVYAITTDTKENVEIGTKQLDSNNIRIYNESDIDIVVTFVSTSNFLINQIDDDSVTNTNTWSSEKTNSEIESLRNEIQLLRNEIEQLKQI